MFGYSVYVETLVQKLSYWDQSYQPLLNQLIRIENNFTEIVTR